MFSFFKKNEHDQGTRIEKVDFLYKSGNEKILFK